MCDSELGCISYPHRNAFISIAIYYTTMKKVTRVFSAASTYQEQCLSNVALWKQTASEINTTWCL